MNKIKLKEEVLILHKKWLNNEKNGAKADLSEAYLREADLREADLREADLREADLNGILANENTCMFFSQIPEKGSYIAYKKAGGYIIELEICEDSKRSSATSLKCRASKAKTIAIYEIDGAKSDFSEIKSDYDSEFIYKINEIVEVLNFDENRWNECAPGIHHFLSFEMAKNYK